MGDVLKQTDRSFHAGTESRWETEIKKKKCWNKTLLADLNNGNRTVSGERLGELGSHRGLLKETTTLNIIPRRHNRALVHMGPSRGLKRNRVRHRDSRMTE